MLAAFRHKNKFVKLFITIILLWNYHDCENIKGSEKYLIKDIYIFNLVIPQN